MPIYDQGYRRYEARQPLRRARFWPITREALRLVLGKRAFLVLLAAAFIPFVVRVVQIYVVTQYPQADRVLPIDGRLFGEFLSQQVGFTILLTIFGASGLVANDLRTGAILAYLSRPLTRRDYVFGKLLVPLLLNLAVTLAPGLLLYVTGLCARARLLHEVGARLDQPGDRRLRGRGEPRGEPARARDLGALAQRPRRRARALRHDRRARDGAADPAAGLPPEVRDAAVDPDRPARAGRGALRHQRPPGGDALGLVGAGAGARSSLGCLLVLRSRVRAVEIVT